MWNRKSPTLSTRGITHARTITQLVGLLVVGPLRLVPKAEFWSRFGGLPALGEHVLTVPGDARQGGACRVAQDLGHGGQGSAPAARRLRSLWGLRPTAGGQHYEDEDSVDDYGAAEGA